MDVPMHGLNFTNISSRKKVKGRKDKLTALSLKKVIDKNPLVQQSPI